MHFIELIAYVLVSFLLLLLVCFRITLTFRTALKYLLIGMLLGSVFVIPLHKFVDPYNTLLAPGTKEAGFWLHFSISALTLFILLWPLRKLAFHVHLCQVQSVSDVFLLSFLTGMGFDLLGLMAAHVSQYNVLDQFTWIPPFQQQLAHHQYTIAGTGYRIGLIVLTAFLMVKYLRNKWAGLFSILIIAAFLSYEVAAINTIPHDKPLTTTLEIIAATNPTVWIPIILVLMFNFLELQLTVRLRKISAASGKALPKSSAGIFNTLWEGNFKQLFKNYQLSRLQRQLEIVEDSLNRNPGNTVIQEIRNRIQHKQKELEESHRELSLQKHRELLPVNVPLLAFISLLFILLLPGGINYFLCVVLGIYIIKKYLLTTQRPAPFHETSHIISAISDKSIAIIAIAAVFLALIGAVDNYFYPPGGVPFNLHMPLTPLFSEWTNNMFNYAQPQGKKSPVYPDAFVVILASMAAGLISSRSWVKLPEHKIKFPWKNFQLVRLFMFFLVLFLCHRLYLGGVKFLHEKYGEVLFYVGTQPATDAQKPAMLPAWLEGVHFMKAAPFGNNLAAWGMGLVVFIAGMIALLLVNMVGKKYKRIIS